MFKIYTTSFQGLQGVIEKVSLFFNLGCISRIYFSGLEKTRKMKRDIENILKRGKLL